MMAWFQQPVDVLSPTVSSNSKGWQAHAVVAASVASKQWFKRLPSWLSVLSARASVCCACSICVLAGDISPIDVITHIPIVCEDNKVPYIFVPSKEVSHCSQAQQAQYMWQHGCSCRSAISG